MTSLPVLLRASALAALLAAAPAFAADAPKAGATPAATVVSVVKARQAEVVDMVRVTGTLVPREEILVGPEIDGSRIVEILADDGDRVEKGQVLARLSRETLEAQLAQSDAQLARADSAIAQARSAINQAEAAAQMSDAAFERAQKLIKSGATTQAVLEQREADQQANAARLRSAKDGLMVAQADRRALEAQRRELMVRMARTDVRSPETGTVSRRSARLGAVAGMAGEALFRIIAKGDVELEAEVPDFRMASLFENQKARVTVAGDMIEGRVRLVASEVDRTTRMGRVRIALGNDPALRIGSFARGEIEVVRRKSLTAPASAVLYDGKGTYAQAVEDNRIVPRRVKTGLASGGLIEIVEGLNEGDTIVARAGAFLNEGDLVEPRLAEMSGARPRTASAAQ